MTREPLARSPIAAAPPLAVVSGWQVSTATTTAALQLSDRSQLAKVAVRAELETGTSGRLGVLFGRTARRGDGVLVVGSGPGEWLLLGAPGAAPALLAEFGDLAGSGTGRLVSVVDLTHGRALMRLTGADAARALSRVCAIDLRDRALANCRALRTLLAKLAVDLIRDDVGAGEAAVPSYLLHCERSSGQYLFDRLLDAGSEFGVGVAGFAPM
jgi:heterotetrameric sarcosine oxidase gamma subunit